MLTGGARAGKKGIMAVTIATIAAIKRHMRVDRVVNRRYTCQSVCLKNENQKALCDRFDTLAATP